MTWISIIKNWLSVSKEHSEEIQQAQDDFMKVFIDSHQGINQFDLITIAQVFTMAYCLGKTSNNK
jgi:hypothetical protein